MQSSHSPRVIERDVFTVSRLTHAVQTLLDGRFGDIWVEGEISNFKRHSSGHCYFTLKDAQAQIRAVLFRGSARHVAFRPQDGMLVQVYGAPSIYAARGDLQIVVRGMKLAGEGTLQKAFELLKRKLAGEGLFDRVHKRPLPRFPRRLGIVTSGTGAALQDVLTIIERRFPCVSVTVCPVRVQGMGAAEAIADAIDAFSRHQGGCDVLIVGRGGGSLEDLWAFNEEIVARAIFASKVPVISAVGHETDTSIADFVADCRAATPSMAAELAVPDRRELLASLQERQTVLTRSLRHRVERCRRRIHHLLSTHGFKRPADRLRAHAQHLDGLLEQFQRCSRHAIESKKTRVRGLGDRLDLLSPELPLRRGYVLVERGDRIVRRAGDVSDGERLTLRFMDARLRVEAKGNV